MLRTTLIAVALVAMAVGLALLVAGREGPGLVVLCDGAVVFLAIVFERWRYQRGRTAAREPPPSVGEPSGEGWERTGERFEDPDTHEIVEVLFNPRSGERRYVRD
ncbi:MAG: hypothetical protein ACRETB_13210 [Steroidobacteraceae bacterium]